MNKCINTSTCTLSKSLALGENQSLSDLHYGHSVWHDFGDVTNVHVLSKQLQQCILYMYNHYNLFVCVTRQVYIL